MNKVSVDESIIRKELLENKVGVRQVQFSIYWVTQKLTQIYTVNLRIRIGKIVSYSIYLRQLLGHPIYVTNKQKMRLLG